ncbi:MAG TPA: ABC transporter permease [Blastocatellia bacterium]|nr:ABC transporter permease [Blastocatellia bacterium]
MMETLFQDIRYGIRALLKNPGFTAIAIITLALGIGANTVIFSVVDSVLLRSLPFKDSDRLVSIWETNSQLSNPDGKNAQASGIANFTDWNSQNQVFDNMAAYFNWTYNLTGVDEPERLEAAVVTGSFFDVLGVQSSMGRTIIPDDDQSGKDNIVVLSHGFWQRRFGSDTAIIGKAITLNRNSFTIIGVMPPDFKFPGREVELWVPAGFNSAQKQDRAGKFLKVIGRLKPNVKVEQARAALVTIAGQLEQQYPDTNAGWSVALVPFQENEVSSTRPALLLLFGAVGFVLLIACANVSNLLLAKGAARRKEMAIRSALGASRGRLISQMFTESALLALLGAGAGILLAVWGMDILISLNPGDIPRLADARIDGRVFAFTLMLSILTAFVFGIVPALFASKPDLQEAIKETGQTVTSSSGLKFHNLLIVSEIAVTLVLLVGAGLMIRSFLHLHEVNPRFNTENMLTMRIWLPASRYGSNEQQTAFFQQVIDRIETVPAVRAVGAIQDIPLKANRMGFNFVIEGRAATRSVEEQDAAYRAITPEYFRTMSIPLLNGRGFTRQDDRNAPPVVIINQSMAQQFFSSEDPIGKRIRFGEQDAPWYSIVGIVSDVKHMGLDAQEGAAIYQPYDQKQFSFLRWMTLVMRTDSEPTGLISAVRSQVQAVDKDQPVYDIATLEQLLSTSVAKPRFYTALLGSFALLALVLASVGIYGVMSFSVNRRRREMGIRLALGADRRDIFKLVVARGLLLTLIGVGIGVAAAFALTRVMSSLLFGVTATDPLTFIAIPLILTGVALGACFVPARRAMKVDPMVALRYE